MRFELQTIETAQEAIKPELEAAQKTYGSIPNLYRGLANNPATLKVYLGFNDALKKYGSLSPIEQQTVYITASAENGCNYCVGAHSTLAGMAKMPEKTLEELREEETLSDPKLKALQNFTLSVMKNRGWVPEQDINAFQDAGYDERHLLEVLTILAQKTLSNYFNHMAQIPLDPMFESHTWEKQEA